MKPKWIWTAEKLPKFNQFVFFRKEFTLNAGFESMQCLVTAERFYQLWINGKWVNQGPALGLPEEKSFDIHDINHLLQPGKNIIAVLVNFDRDKRIGTNHTNWFIPKTRAGLLCQVEGKADDTPFQLTSDETWLTRPAYGWNPEAPFLNDMYHQEHYSFGKDQTDWNQAGFNNGGWHYAVVLGDADGNGIEGNKLPWLKLVERDIPPLSRKLHLPVHVQTGEIVEQFGSSDIGLRMTLEAIKPLEKAEIGNECNLLIPGDDICTLCNSDLQESEDTWDGNHDPTLILDFGELCNAHLVIEAKGPAGANLHIGYGPNLVEGRVFPYRSERTSWADSIELDGTGWNRWRSYHWRQFRYV
ncbi:alpha-L-rhamnosidase N-terminal domain-containing protein, partial [bacterium]|nr:alpha-L-rhamnosidase N-terminal domain-containing protein [bacterium]